ncbi:hypothetical protein Metfor_1642 [Methanoregula formicica SMSP]|uniref:Uncharacterized protein n=1 Tax=Methanoregula formicica (strain DSM 22288 / NBRC 105244 / SMSP) TaxID=593750 RepID=L0HD93_METFS|nr:hypothetical protein Metfor_1642 [Methanoregula formicica SMSP]
MSPIKKIPVNPINRSLLVAVFFLAMALAIAAGCTAPAGTDNASEDISSVPVTSAALYRATINQPDALSGFVKMDTDIYNSGEVVEFTVINDGSGTLICAGNPPAFSVITQTPGGTWSTKMGSGQPDRAAGSALAPGASTRRYTFVTTGWEPGRYRIVHDCGIEREFLVRALPPATLPVTSSLTPVPDACPETNTTTTAPWIAIAEIGRPVAYQPFTIRGTTNLPAGEELVYTIFAVGEGDAGVSLDNQGSFRTTVIEGTCGTNTWEAHGEIQATGEFAIGIMGTDKTPSAIRKFTVIPE